jgi:hypothetical protein
MTDAFSMIVTPVGIATCQISGRRGACCKVETKGPHPVPPKIIDKRRLTEFYDKALGAAELFSPAIDGSGKPNDASTTSRQPSGRSQGIGFGHSTSIGESAGQTVAKTLDH